MAVLRQSVFCGHAMQAAGDVLSPSSLSGKTISSLPKQTGQLGFSSFIFTGQSLHIALIGKAEVPVMPNDDMFVNCNTHHLAGKNEFACNGDIFLRRLGISRRVIVRENQGRRMVVEC